MGLLSCESDLQLLGLGKVGAPALGREEAIVEGDVRVDSGGEDQRGDDELVRHRVFVRAG